jgi:multidrug efflux pump subunit AcrA (membrane-fusion protein)
MNTERTRASWLVYALGALCAGAIVAAVLVVGPASGSTTTVTRTATVAQGVVQSTVSGSGNLQAASQLNLGFKTSGTVTDIYVSQGEHVTQGQLLATLDPQSSEVTLEQAKASLLSAEANLAKEEETNGEGTTSGGSANSATAGAATASTASVRPADVADVATTAAAPAADGAPTATAPTTSTPTTTTGTTPSPTTPSTTTSTTPATPTSTTSSPSTNTATTPTATTPSKTTTTRGSTAAEPTTTTKAGSTSSSASAPVSAATREANLASARAAVKSDKLTVESDEQAVQNTKLYAPESGTIVSLSGQVGETVSGGGTTKASSTSSSSESTGGGTTGAAATTGARSSTSTTGSSSSTSSSFAVLSDLSTMKLVVPLSESEIGNVKDGQIATVTVEALSGAKLAAHVSEVALTSTSNSGVVSYDVTFQLDQMEGGLKTGMSATAEVIVKQAEGINVPTSAISADSVTVERSGKQVRERVVTGLAGNTSTIILSGLKAGETVVLPAATTTSSSTSGAASRLGSRLGGAGGGLAGAAGGGGGFAGGGGGAAFFRGGG